jgi:polysaccharide biosynthesis/export protein
MPIGKERKTMIRTKGLHWGLAIFVLLGPLTFMARAPIQAQSQSSQEGSASASPTATQNSVHDDRQADSGRPVLQQRYPRYKIQRDDVLTLSFPLSPEFNQTVTVQPDGYISLYGGPSVHIQGMTVPEAGEAIKKAYSGTLHNPIIDVDLQDFQKAFFTVSGQVGKPGQYDLRHDTTVAEAIGIAGGFLPTAKTQVFLFHRTSSTWAEVREIKLNDILNGKKASEDSQLSSGDMIFVPEKFIANFRKYVPYNLSSGIYANPF